MMKKNEKKNCNNLIENGKEVLFMMFLDNNRKRTCYATVNKLPRHFEDLK
jgi:hypothetical protein